MTEVLWDRSCDGAPRAARAVRAFSGCTVTDDMYVGADVSRWAGIKSNKGLCGKAKMMRSVHLVGALLCLPVMLGLLGCGSGVPSGDGGGGETLKVNFDASGGNYAVGEDEAGNEYTFRAREDDDGNTVITEANIKTSDGTTLKASLDSEGRPVNFRMSDNTAADLVYDSQGVVIRYTGAGGQLIEEGQEVNYTLAKARVQARRAAGPSKASTRMQAASAKADVLRAGLETYEEIVESICDEEANPDSPLATNPQAGDLKEAALRLGEVASLFDLEEVERDELGDDVNLDEVPEVIHRLAGNTYVLFDAEGLCIELTDTANSLTFDGNGILLTEVDRHLVFPDFSLGGADPDVTINYLTGTPINLNPSGEGGFEAIVTPVFTGTQLDDLGRVTIERRFQADLTFPVDLFGAAEAEAHKLFDAAFLNGALSEDGSLLEVDLVLIDLEEENPALQLGRLRYHDQNSVPPERIFPCEVMTGENVGSGLVCPGGVAEGEDFPVEFLFGREDQDRVLDFDWFISDGFGLILGDSFGPEAMVRATAPGFLEVTLVVSDLTEVPSVFEVFTCGINVGREPGGPPPPGLFLECPPGLNIGEPGYFSVSGPDAGGLDFPNWFVFGTSDFFIDDPFRLDAIVEFYQPGKFEVAFQGFDMITGAEVFASCEVLVGGIGFDECEANGWYGDGECDEFCPLPDPDCDFFHDICELNGWYGDGECDEFCPWPDPDCEGQFDDICAENGWYGDGECDLFCPMPDPDCDVGHFDICAENGWYGDGECDEFCPHPDPDCEFFVDICAENGWYGDGECDEFCPRPDPDCGIIDICELNGWYGDGECDLFCPLPDPDCGEGDICEINGWYGDGECDLFCPLPDPDCEMYDVCAENGWYGDGECDEFCPLPDPDCEFIDICELNGYYSDGVCDDFCPLPDPDCDVVDICAENGWYGDGECDDFCPLPDPDCDVVDICAENGWYGDYECDEFCPLPDPDCEDECVLNGWYWDGECDEFCPLPDPDCF